ALAERPLCCSDAALAERPLPTWADRLLGGANDRRYPRWHRVTNRGHIPARRSMPRSAKLLLAVCAVVVASCASSEQPRDATPPTQLTTTSEVCTVRVEANPSALSAAVR